MVLGNKKESEEEAIVAMEMEEEEGVEKSMSGFKNFLWNGGSVYDAWFSCASNQVAQVLLTLPYSFSQLGMVSGIILQVFYGLLGSWTAYLISVLYVEYRTRKEKENVSFKNHVIQWFEVLDGLLGPQWKAIGLAFNCTLLLFGSVIQLIACASNIYYINEHLDKRTWTYIFGVCCATTVFVPSFRNYRIWSFLGLGMTTYTAWYLTIAAFIHGQDEGVVHSGPQNMVLYFTGATNILYTFGGHAVTVEIMHAMWKPQKFKYIYVFATFYVFTLTLPSASTMYWAFGDKLLTHSNAFSLLPRNGFRDAGVILMLIHQFITFGFACTPLYFVWEKAVGMHDTKSICLRALARLPVVIPIWFLAIIFPFFGPISSAVGALLVSFTVYIIPALAHMLTYRKVSARQNAVEKPPFFLPSWTAMYMWFEVLDGLLGPNWKAIGLAFNCTFLLFGSVIQLIACASNIYYINDHLDKRTWTYIFGVCCATTVFVPSFQNYRIWSFLGLGMTTYTAWYLTIAAFIHGQDEGVVHSGPQNMVLYFTGATNILYTFGGHAVTVEIMHAMWKPQKFKYIYLFATFYVFTLTLPSAAAMYWAFGDKLLTHSNAFSLLPRNGFRDAGVILMLIHQFITFGYACTPLYFVWEKAVGMHDTKSIFLRALARLPVVIPIWFLAIIFPFFGPINSAVGALLVSFTVYIIPALAHMLTYLKGSARQNAVEKPPFFLPSWTAMYMVNIFIVVWILVVGFGFGGWASMTNFIKQVDTFGLFAKCYQCAPPPPVMQSSPPHH